MLGMGQTFWSCNKASSPIRPGLCGRCKTIAISTGYASERLRHSSVVAFGNSCRISIERSGVSSIWAARPETWQRMDTKALKELEESLPPIPMPEFGLGGHELLFQDVHNPLGGLAIPVRVVSEAHGCVSILVLQ